MSLNPERNLIRESLKGIFSNVSLEKPKPPLFVQLVDSLARNATQINRERSGTETPTINDSSTIGNKEKPSQA